MDRRALMNIEGDWAGNIVGTNTGRVFAEFAQDKGITGTVRLNDDAFGIFVYTCTGTVADELELGLRSPTIDRGKRGPKSSSSGV